MNLLNLLTVFSSLSFLSYGIAYFKSPKMKDEFNRFGLEKVGTIVVFELMGALGLLVGLKYIHILITSAAGLTLLMFFGSSGQVKSKRQFLDILSCLLFYGIKCLHLLCGGSNAGMMSYNSNPSLVSQLHAYPNSNL